MFLENKAFTSPHCKWVIILSGGSLNLNIIMTIPLFLFMDQFLNYPADKKVTHKKEKKISYTQVSPQGIRSGRQLLSPRAEVGSSTNGGGGYK